MTNISKLPLVVLEEAIKTGREFYFICGYTDDIIKTSISKAFCNIATNEFTISYRNLEHGEYIQGAEKNNFSQCCSIAECFLTEKAAKQYIENDTTTI